MIDGSLDAYANLLSPDSGATTMDTESSKKEAIPEEFGLSAIAISFSQNLLALRIFTNQVGDVADKHDRRAFANFGQVLSELFPELSDALAQEDKQDPLTPGSKRADGQVKEQGPTLDKERIRKVLDDPTKRDQLFSAVKAVAKAAPVQGGILRTSALVSLMIYLEALVADLIHVYYLRYPAALPADERTLTLAELRVIGSVQSAEKYLVDKEVDSVLRESLDSQLSYFTKRFKIDTSPLQRYRPSLIEIDQRRNLIVHNKGRVNRTYLERVDPELCNQFGASAGEPLTVRVDYLRRSIDVVETAGTILLQSCWRKWDSDSSKEADGRIINELYDGLQEERYDVVVATAEFASSISMSDAVARMVCVNHAIALRDSGKEDKVQAVLDRYDWSACSLRFKLALLAVRREEEGFYDLLPRAAAASEVTKQDLEEWPLFRPFRESARFTAEVDRLFPEG